MPARLIALRQNGGDERWCQKPGLHKRSPGNCQHILGMRPLQEVLAFYGVGFAVMFDHRSVGQIRYPRLMSCKALGMEFPVEVINLAPADKVLGIRPAAKETGAMACSQSGDLIKKEQ